MEIFSWMFCCQNIPLFRHCNMGIDFRDIDGAMPKHFLDIADVYICFQQACGEGMPEHMWGDM